MVERWRSLEASSWQGSPRPRISSDAREIGRGSERSDDVRGKLIDDEIVAYWLRRAVELGDDDGEDISPRTIFKASETVFGRGLDCFWASTWAAAGL
jgi:hypothetical protein